MSDITYRLFGPSPSDSARHLSHLSHEKQRTPIRAKCDEIRASLGWNPGPWVKP